jgi:hypothetical protein
MIGISMGLLACEKPQLSLTEELIVNRKWQLIGNNEYIVFKENHSYEVYNFISLNDYGTWTLKNNDTELNMQSMKDYKNRHARIIEISETTLETEPISILASKSRNVYKAI